MQLIFVALKYSTLSTDLSAAYTDQPYLLAVDDIMLT